jgi:hypothetical protein
MASANIGREKLMRMWPLIVILTLACDAKTGETGGPPTPVSGKDYRVELSEPKTMTAGAPSACVLTVAASAPWVIKAETPFAALLEPGPGLKVAKALLDGKDFIDPKAPAKAVRTACTAESTGAHTLTSKVSFFLCTHEICRRVVHEMKSTLNAK